MRQGQKLDRVAVMSQNFDRILKTGAGPAPDAARTLDFLDLPQAIADRFNVQRLELQHAQVVSAAAADVAASAVRLAKSVSRAARRLAATPAGNAVGGGGAPGTGGV